MPGSPSADIPGALPRSRAHGLGQRSPANRRNGAAASRAVAQRAASELQYRRGTSWGRRTRAGSCRLGAGLGRSLPLATCESAFRSCGPAPPPVGLAGQYRGHHGEAPVQAEERRLLQEDPHVSNPDAMRARRHGFGAAGLTGGVHRRSGCACLVQGPHRGHRGRRLDLRCGGIRHTVPVGSGAPPRRSAAAPPHSGPHTAAPAARGHPADPTALPSPKMLRPLPAARSCLRTCRSTRAWT